jgi:hypothetical protein
MDKSELNIIETVLKHNKKSEVFLNKLFNKNQPFLYRKTNFMVTIIHNNVKYTYPNRSEGGFNIAHLWLFRTVQLNALAFIKAHPDWKLGPKQSVNKTNYRYDDMRGELTGTDINSAYWEIAYKMGIISESTYTKAHFDQYKKIRLASLATLGRKMVYQSYQGSVNLKQPVIVEYQADKLRDLYKAIRYQCFDMMNELASMLGEDFEAYRTDCIYYRDSPQNRELVHSYLKEKGFTFKQLVYDEQINTDPDEDVDYEYEEDLE